MKFGISFGALSWDLGKFLNPITEKVQDLLIVGVKSLKGFLDIVRGN